MIDDAAERLSQAKRGRGTADIGEKTAEDRESRAKKQVRCPFERAVQLGLLLRLRPSGAQLNG
jgi:hypothetical protein